MRGSETDFDMDLDVDTSANTALLSPTPSRTENLEISKKALGAVGDNVNETDIRSFCGLCGKMIARL